MVNSSRYRKWYREYLDYMKYERLFSQETIDFRRNMLRQFLDYLGNKPLNEKNIKSFIRKKAAQGLKPRSLNGYIRDLKVFAKYLFETNKLPQDYGANLKRLKLKPSLPEVLSLEEVKAIVYSKRKYRYDKVKKTYDFIFELLAKTGLRRKECYMLDVGDFDFQKGIINIRFAKGGRQRHIPIPEDMIKPLQNWFKARKINNLPNSPVFISRQGTRIDGESIRLEMKYRAKAAGITKRVYPHMLRHSFITELLKQDVSVAKVSRLVGHVSTEITTRVYTHLVVDDLKEASNHHPLVNGNGPKKPESNGEIKREVIIIVERYPGEFNLNKLKNNYLIQNNSSLPSIIKTTK